MMGIFDFEKARKEKEIVESFLEAAQDKDKLDEWKREHADYQKEKDTFWF